MAAHDRDASLVAVVCAASRRCLQPTLTLRPCPRVRPAAIFRCHPVRALPMAVAVAVAYSHSTSTSATGALHQARTRRYVVKVFFLVRAGSYYRAMVGVTYVQALLFSKPLPVHFLCLHVHASWWSPRNRRQVPPAALAIASRASVIYLVRTPIRVRVCAQFSLEREGRNTPLLENTRRSYDPRAFMLYMPVCMCRLVEYSSSRYGCAAWRRSGEPAATATQAEFVAGAVSSWFNPRAAVCRHDFWVFGLFVWMLVFSQPSNASAALLCSLFLPCAAVSLNGCS